MPSTKAELILDPRDFRELAFVARFADTLPQIAEAASEVPAGKDFATIAPHVSEKTGLPPADIERILLSLQNLPRLQARMNVTAEELLDRIAEGFVPHSDDEEDRERLELWRGARGAILEVMKAIGRDRPWPYLPSNHEEWLAERARYAILMLRDCTEVNPKKRGGVPVLKGTRFTLAQILAEIAEGRSIVDLAEDFELDSELIKEFLEGIAISLDRPFYQ